MENEQIKQLKTIPMDKKLREATNLCEEIMSSKRQVKEKLGHVVKNSRLTYKTWSLMALLYKQGTL